jgi:N-acetylmuramoyl-L-alanine amidase
MDLNGKLRTYINHLVKHKIPKNWHWHRDIIDLDIDDLNRLLDLINHCHQQLDENQISIRDEAKELLDDLNYMKTQKDVYFKIQEEEAEKVDKLIDDLEERSKSFTFTRRSFLKGAAATGILALIKKPVNAFTNLFEIMEDQLYDLQLAVFENKDNAIKSKNEILINLSSSEIRNYVYIYQRDNKFYIIIKLNTPHLMVKIIQRIIKGWYEIDSFIKDSKFFKAYSYIDLEKITDKEKITFEHYSVIPLITDPSIFKDNIIETIVTYLKVFNNEDIRQKKAFIEQQNKNQFVLIKTEWLKPFIRSNHEVNKDYLMVLFNSEDPATKSLYSIALNFGEGDINVLIDILIKYNGIDKDKSSLIISNVPIAIPIKNYLIHDKQEGPDIDFTEDEIIDKTPEKNIIVTPNPKAINFIRESGFATLYCKHPSSYLEGFFISNEEDRKIYSYDRNLKEFSEKIAKGALNHMNKTNRNILILECGHGKNDPGAIYPQNSKKPIYTETKFAIKICNYIKKYIEDNKKKVVILYYEGSANARKRVNWVKNEANKHNNALFIAVHINSSTSSKPKGTEIYSQVKIFKNKKPNNNYKVSLAFCSDIASEITFELKRRFQ